MKVTSLSSGSSGNCYLVQAGETNILIDCGLSSQKVKEHLEARAIKMEQLTAIFLTHEHSDHLKGAGAISRRWGTPIYANQATLAAAKPSWEKMLIVEQQRAAQMGWKAPEARPYNIQVLPTGASEWLGGLEVSSFPVSHDATETVCYTFRADGQQGVILTDLGCATPAIFEPLCQSNLIILEANHDLDDLNGNSRYPYPLKKRISGNHGHLSNQQSAEILQTVIERSNTQHTVWLAHLSEQNNSPQKAFETIAGHLQQASIQIDFFLDVALRDAPSLTYDSSQPPAFKPVPLIPPKPVSAKSKKRAYQQLNLFE